MLLSGALVFMLGIGAALMSLLGGAPPETSAVGPGGAAIESASASASLLWPVLAGLLLGTGAFLMGISLGRWKNPRTHSEPGDEVVNPEGHETMKHV